MPKGLEDLAQLLVAGPMEVAISIPRRRSHWAAALISEVASPRRSPAGAQVGPLTVTVDDHAALVERLQQKERVAPLGPRSACDVDLAPELVAKAYAKAQAIERFLLGEFDEEIHVGGLIVVSAGRRAEEDRESNPLLGAESASLAADRF